MLYVIYYLNYKEVTVHIKFKKGNTKVATWVIGYIDD